MAVNCQQASICVQERLVSERIRVEARLRPRNLASVSNADTADGLGEITRPVAVDLIGCPRPDGTSLLWKAASNTVVNATASTLATKAGPNTLITSSQVSNVLPSISRTNPLAFRGSIC